MENLKSLLFKTMLCLIHPNRPTVGLWSSRGKSNATLLVLTRTLIISRKRPKNIYLDLISNSGRLLAKLKASSLAEESVQLLVLGVHRGHRLDLHREDALLVVNPSGVEHRD